MQRGTALSSIKLWTSRAIIVSVSCFYSRFIMTLIKKKGSTSCVTSSFFSWRKRKRKDNISDS